MNTWDKTITLYNRFENTESGVVKWYRHVLTDCFVKHTKRLSNAVGVQKTSSENIIRIPEQSNYVSVFDWIMLSDDLKGDYITLQGGDLIVLGGVSDDIDELRKGLRSSDLIAKYKDIGSLTVNSVNINTDLPAAHYLVRGD